MPMTIDKPARDLSASTAPRVRIVTDLGDILVELYPEHAPNSVAGFLAEVSAGTYDGGTFSRIVRTDNDRGTPTIEVIQAGIKQGPEPRLDIAFESTLESGLRHDDGTISLPRINGSPASAQGFFICVGNQPALDAGGGRVEDDRGFGAFGRVIAGMDVVRAIHAAPTLEDAPLDYMKGQVAAQPPVIHRIALEADTATALLSDLAADYWSFRTREFPTEASALGFRGHGHLLDEATADAHERRALLCGALLARAGAIDPAALDVEERTSLALLTEQLGYVVEAHARDAHRRPMFYPFNFAGLPTSLVQQTPLESLQDRDDFLVRLEAIPAYFEANLDLLREGFARGYRVPRCLIPQALALVDSDLAAGGLSKSLGEKFAAQVPAADSGRLMEQRDRLAALLADSLLPSLEAVRSFIAGLDAELTDEVGVWSQPGGRDYYRFRVRQQTSTDIDPDTIHATGLSEVARIQREMEEVLAKMGRAGERGAVAAELDARQAPDADALLAHTRAYAKKVDALLPRLFGRMPRITYGVEPFTAAASIALPPALAQPAPADRSMPGIFWLTALPEKLPLHLIPALTLHEAWPGHLMQMGIAHELEQLPDFRRYLWQDYNGYIEGWALYCERLGHDLGLYDDPADEFGLLTSELWRAARLVVDTGIHWLGWDRERAVSYLSTNAFLPQAVCESEVDRYIGWPGQALSYKTGERAIWGLRSEAEAALGERFSLRTFHDFILGLGPVSLFELRRRVRAWIETFDILQTS